MRTLFRERRLALAGVVLGGLSWGCAGSGDNEVGGAQDEPLGDTHSLRRASMVETLVEYGISDVRVLKAMGEIPRHRFVPPDMAALAYRDSPLPIGHDQTISQPFIVAFMTEQLMPRRDDVVLEVGTGSGYQAAVLARLVKHVYSIEIVEPLARGAQQTLEELGFDNVSVKYGDGYRGWREHAPFASIIVTCAPDQIPEPLVEQLDEGGRMVIPVGDAGVQKLYVLEKRDGAIQRRDVLDVRFVPMTGEAERRE